MNVPAVTRQRRPFLAPLWVPALAVLIFLILAFIAYRDLTTTTVVLVRHGEKELSTIDDPPLTPEGEQRAERLGHLFSTAGGPGRIKAIYVSDTRRSQQTAAPLAARLRLQPTVMPAADVDGLARRALREHHGGAVLIIGHSNTIPELIQRMAGIKIAPIADGDFDAIYVLSVPTLGNASLLRLAY